MFSLKSELFKKQQELTSRKSGSSAAETIRRQHKLKTPGTAADVVPENEKNPGVDARNEKDLAQTSEEQDKSKMVKSVLEAKSKLYEKMTSGDVLPDEESSAIFLVDFEQKSIDARMKRKNLDKKPELGVNVASELSAEVEKASNPGEEWVEYTDGLGRTRQCLKKDLPRMHQIDKKLGIETKLTKSNETKTLLSDDMRREMEREKWEEEAMEELNGPIHYENLRAGEIRELGVGYYAFSTDQETREKQIKMLQKMRDETEKEKRNLKEAEKKKRTALQARLEKVRLGRIKKLKSKGKEIPAELLKPVELPPLQQEDEEKEKVKDDVTVVEVTKRDDSDRPMREWDEGKEWTPAELPKAPKSWQDPREQRPEEFAPPSFYFKNKKAKHKKPEPEEEPPSDTATENTELKESPGDLISRIRKELTEVAKNSLNSTSSVSAKSHSEIDCDDVTENDKTSHDNENNEQSPSAQNNDTSPTGKNESSHEESSDSVQPSQLYVPSSAPITMKVKTVPKKTPVLQTKSAFSDDS